MEYIHIDTSDDLSELNYKIIYWNNDFFLISIPATSYRSQIDWVRYIVKEICKYNSEVGDFVTKEFNANYREKKHFVEMRLKNIQINDRVTDTVVRYYSAAREYIGYNIRENGFKELWLGSFNDNLEIKYSQAIKELDGVHMCERKKNDIKIDLKFLYDMNKVVVNIKDVEIVKTTDYLIKKLRNESNKQRTA